MKIISRAAAMLLALVLSFGILSVSANAEAGTIAAGIGIVNATGLNLRAAANTSAQILATASSRECVVVLGQEGNWYHVVYNHKEGYMSAEYLSVSATGNAELGEGRVIGTSVNLRNGPSTSYASVGTAGLGDTCTIIGLNQGWYKINYNSQTCYIRSDFVSLTSSAGNSTAAVSTPQNTTAASGNSSVNYGGSASGMQILSLAQQYLGTPYVYGGASPAGFDCSGFVYYVLKCFGYSPERTPSGQINMGIAVDKSNLQPGDIVFFANTGGSGITHSGIYAGNGQFIHSPNSRSTVSYSDLLSGYWAEHFYAARRVATS